MKKNSPSSKKARLVFPTRKCELAHKDMCFSHISFNEHSLVMERLSVCGRKSDSVCILVCMCLCVAESERNKEREREGERERILCVCEEEREKKSVRMYVW